MSHPSKDINPGFVHIEELEQSQQQKPAQQSNKEQQVEQSGQQKKQQVEQSGQQKKQQANDSQQQPDGVTIFCRICEDFIAHSVTTICEHTFCEYCLLQYMLYIDQCPQCGARIRHQRLSNNILLDNLIMDYIKKYEPEEVPVFQERIEKFKTYQKEKKQVFSYQRLNQFEAGMKVDVRDSDYVWCTGRIYRTVNKFQEKKVKWMIVKYDKSSKKEEFPENSPRIAPLGFYTNRKDIPRYHRGKLILENQQENVTYTIPNYYDQEEQKENP